MEADLNPHVVPGLVNLFFLPFPHSLYIHTYLFLSSLFLVSLYTSSESCVIR